jgi:hypothetical protein
MDEAAEGVAAAGGEEEGEEEEAPHPDEEPDEPNFCYLSVTIGARVPLSELHCDIVHQAVEEENRCDARGTVSGRTSGGRAGRGWAAFTC